MAFKKLNSEEAWNLVEVFKPISDFIVENGSTGSYRRALMVLRTLHPNNLRLDFQSGERQLFYEHEHPWDARNTGAFDDGFWCSLAPINYTRHGAKITKKELTTMGRDGYEQMIDSDGSESWYTPEDTTKHVWEMFQEVKEQVEADDDIDLLNAIRLYMNCLADAVAISTIAAEAMRLSVVITINGKPIQVGKISPYVRILTNIPIILAKCTSWGKRGAGAVLEAYHRIMAMTDKKDREKNKGFLEMLETQMIAKVGQTMARSLWKASTLKVGYRQLQRITIATGYNYTPIQFFTIEEFCSLTEENRTKMWKDPTVSSTIPGVTVNNKDEQQSVIFGAKTGALYMPIDVTEIPRRATIKYKMGGDGVGSTAKVAWFPVFRNPGFNGDNTEEWRGQKSGLTTSGGKNSTDAVYGQSVDYMIKAFDYAETQNSGANARSIIESHGMKRTKFETILIEDAATGAQKEFKSAWELFFLTVSKEEQEEAQRNMKKTKSTAALEPPSRQGRRGQTLRRRGPTLSSLLKNNKPGPSGRSSQGGDTRRDDRSDAGSTSSKSTLMSNEEKVKIMMQKRQQRREMTIRQKEERKKKLAEWKKIQEQFSPGKQQPSAAMLKDIEEDMVDVALEEQYENMRAQQAWEEEQWRQAQQGGQPNDQEMVPDIMPEIPRFDVSAPPPPPSFDGYSSEKFKAFMVKQRATAAKLKKIPTVFSEEREAANGDQSEA